MNRTAHAVMPIRETRIHVQPGTTHISGQLVLYKCTMCGQWNGIPTIPARHSPNWVGLCCLSGDGYAQAYRG